MERLNDTIVEVLNTTIQEDTLPGSKPLTDMQVTVIGTAISPEKMMFNIIEKELVHTDRIMDSVSKLEDSLLSEAVVKNLPFSKKLELYSVISARKDSSQRFLGKMYEVAAKTSIFKEFLEKKAPRRIIDANSEEVSDKVKDVRALLEKMIHDSVKDAPHLSDTIGGLEDDL